jgi:pyruvate carboxylase
MLAAANAGADAVDAAMDAMAGTSSQPSMGAIVGALAGTSQQLNQIASPHTLNHCSFPALKVQLVSQLMYNARSAASEVQHRHCHWYTV